jgi:hypothetical protein
MRKKEITINGKNYPVIFTMATLSNFEEILGGKPFFGQNLNTVKNRVAIIYAAALAADENTELTVQELRGKESFEDYQQIAQAYTVIMQLAETFFNIPESENGKDEDQAAEEGDAKPKN